MGDTDLTADAGKSSASRQTFVSGNAAKGAGADLRRQLIERLGFGDRADADVTLALDGDRLVGRCRGEERALDLRALTASARRGEAAGACRIPICSSAPATSIRRPCRSTPTARACRTRPTAFAAQIAEVEVDVELGTVTLLHVHAAHDVGRAINPTQVEGQIHGGIAQGIGMALMEEYVNGRTDNLHDYLIPTVGDVPPITVHLIEDPEPLGPWGAKGVGEPALVATAPAILNAIHAATGVRMHEVPVTPAPPARGAAGDGGAMSDPGNFAARSDGQPVVLEHSRAPEKMAADKVRCEACPVLCQISPGKLGACDRYGNVDGVLTRLDTLHLVAKPGVDLVAWQAARGEGWDGSLVDAAHADAPVFVSGIGSGTTYPDYKPAPFIVASKHDGVDLVTVVTEGIFSYCSFKVKIDTDRYLGPEQATVRHRARRSATSARSSTARSSSPSAASTTSPAARRRKGASPAR